MFFIFSMSLKGLHNSQLFILRFFLFDTKAAEQGKAKHIFTHKCSNGLHLSIRNTKEEVQLMAFHQRGAVIRHDFYTMLLAFYIVQIIHNKTLTLSSFMCVLLKGTACCRHPSAPLGVPLPVVRFPFFVQDLGHSRRVLSGLVSHT